VEAAALTDSEQRFVSVVVCGTRAATEEATLATLDDREASAGELRLHAAVVPFGAQLERLFNGSFVAYVVGRGTATDQAAQAARCALALRALLPDVPIVLTTGRGIVTGRLPVGEVIDRAAVLLGPAPLVEGSTRGSTRPTRPVAIDDVTAGLLDARFEVISLGRGLALVSERETDQATRTLLGKPTPFVGREREVSTLMATARQCFEERVARVCLVTGPAGAGKSRLRTELVKAIRDDSPELERSGAWGTSNAANVDIILESTTQPKNQSHMRRSNSTDLIQPAFGSTSCLTRSGGRSTS
jgi:hypothetical protein